jgi:hypothetical protein
MEMMEMLRPMNIATAPARTVLRDLTANGVFVWVNGDLLTLDGPKSVLTDELLTTLRARKVELLDYLERLECSERFSKRANH